MPLISRTAPRSPDLVRKACSSQKPYRLTCAANEPASFQSFVICSILNIAPLEFNPCRLPLHGVVTSAKFAGVEQNPEDFNVVHRRNTRDHHADDEQTDT